MCTKKDFSFDLKPIETTKIMNTYVLIHDFLLLNVKEKE